MIHWRYSSLIFLVVIIGAEIANCTSKNSEISENNVGSSTAAADNNRGGGLNSLNGDDENNNEDEEIGDDQQDSNKFTWLHHNEDHAIYAHRSLMSTANIKHINSSDESISIEDFSALKKVDFVEKEWQLMMRAMDQSFDSMSASLLLDIGKNLNIFDEILARLKPECRRDLNHMRDSIRKHKIWALKMLDSIGKIPSGITYGKFSSPGDYEECLSVRVNENVFRGKQQQRRLDHHKFHGKYCLFDFRLPLPEKPKNKLLSVHEPVLDLSQTELGKRYPEIMNYSAYASVFYDVGYMHGFCLPSTCEVTDLTQSLQHSLEGLYVIVNNTVDCQENPEEGVPLRTSQIISIILMSALFINAGLASFIYHYLPRNMKTHNYAGNQNNSTKGNGFKKVNDDKNNRDEHDNSSSSSLNLKLKFWASKMVGNCRFYPECFSIQSNFERLTKPDPRGLTFVHYTRIVAMFLTVITHTGAMGTLQAITKPADASNSESIFRDLLPQMLANAFTSIQIFFFMAGFMLVLSTYPSIKRERGHLSFVEYAIKRAIRLLPGLTATVVINFLWPLFVDGPMLTYFIRMIVEPCESNWWRTLGFLSNFDHVEKMCLRHSYFSASDYQLHLVAFPLLLLLYKQPTISLIIAGILTLAGFVAQVIMVLTKPILPFIMVDYIDKEALFNVIHYIHHPVWNHMSAFFYGFIIGYLVVKQVRVDLKEKTIKRIWMLLLPMGLVSIFAPYFWNHYKRQIYRWQMVLYVIFDRFILLTACAWLSYATMVLSRPKKKKIEGTTTTTNTNNLPEIITFQQESGEKSKQQSPQLIGKQQLSASSTGLARVPSLNVIADQQQAINESLLNFNTSSIPRQRSSPDLHQILKQQVNDNDTTNVVRSTLTKESISSSMKQQEKENSNQNDNNTTNNNKQLQEITTSRKKPQASISNINILCLVLSRLTFQLYLFNMVVLWIDVNHSKYFWFFSYYFIITKAISVYIFSTIMAMIFFITMESPALSIYIMWVKKRAQARANKKEKLKQEKQDNLEDNKRIEKIITNKTTSLPSSQTHNFQSEQNFDDGLCMKIGTPTIDESRNKLPSFSFIDLSSPGGNNLGPSSSKLRKSDDNSENNQTKM